MARRIAVVGHMDRVVVVGQETEYEYPGEQETSISATSQERYIFELDWCPQTMYPACWECLGETAGS